MAENPYLALRAAKIARNEARLAALGFAAPSSSSRRSSGSTRREQQRDRRQPLVRFSSSDKEDAPSLSSPRNTMVVVSLRRSSRLRKAANASSGAAEEEANTNATIERSNSWTRKEPKRVNLENMINMPATTNMKRRRITRSDKAHPSDSNQTIQDMTTTTFSTTKHNKDTNPDKWNARFITLDVDLLLQEFLGTPMAQTGKRFVMEEAARIAAPSFFGTTNTYVRFNKYSGIQEWSYGRIFFLWVNLGNPKADVANEFLQNGSQITFFGGSNMKRDSRVIQGLMDSTNSTIGSSTVAPVARTTSKANDPSPPIRAAILWCRSYNKDTKSFGPYTCLGRLQLVSMDPELHPLPFVFELLDYHKMWGPCSVSSAATSSAASFTLYEMVRAYSRATREGAEARDT